MTDLKHIDFSVVGMMFDDSSIFQQDIQTLQVCLAKVSNSAIASVENRQRGEQMAETIRHLIFLRQTEQAHKDSRVATWTAIAVALASTLAASVQAGIMLWQALKN
jgi:hypothetical protein